MIASRHELDFTFNVLLTSTTPCSDKPTTLGKITSLLRHIFSFLFFSTADNELEILLRRSEVEPSFGSGGAPGQSGPSLVVIVYDWDKLYV